MAVGLATVSANACGQADVRASLDGPAAQAMFMPT
jgi:hypothetical protein